MCIGKKFFTDNKFAISCGILGVIILSVFGSFFLIAKTADQVKQFVQNDNPSYYNSISVDGVGEVTTLPDVASFIFSVNETSESVDSAQKMATEKNNKALDYLKIQGIEERDIKTISYNIGPKYEWREESDPTGDYRFSGKNILIGYEISQNIEVKIRDIKKSGEIFAGIGSVGISSVSSLEFKVDNDEAIKAEARAKAIADSKKKAEEIAKSLGVKITRTVSFYENTDQPIYGGYGMGGDSMEAKTVSTAPQLPAGENKIASRVSVTYEIK